MSIIRRTCPLFLFNLLILTTTLGMAQGVLGTIPTDTGPIAIAVNEATNRVYVSNVYAGTVTVIDGATDTVLTTVIVGRQPTAIAANPLTNRIYTPNHLDNNVTVINGQTNATQTVTVGTGPYAIAINQKLNKIYVTNDTINGSVTGIDGATNGVWTTPVGQNPQALAVNPSTNRLYVANRSSNTVSVLDARTMVTMATTTVGATPTSVAVNAQTNLIYVGNNDGLSVSVIQGASNMVIATIGLGGVPRAVALNPVTGILYVADSNPKVTMIAGTQKIGTVNLHSMPLAMVVNPVTNKIYISEDSGEMQMINGDSNQVVTLPVGISPRSIAANVVINRVYVGNYSDNTVTVISGGESAPLEFVPVPPCRLIDTRHDQGGPIQANTSRNFPVPQLGGCGIPESAMAFALNVTVVPRGPLGYLTIWPAGEEQPLVSTMNSLDGRFKANAAIIPAGYLGGISVYATNTTDLVLDINGYFRPPGSGTYKFYTVTPCRVIDTREQDDTLHGPYLAGGVQRDFPVMESPCMPQGPDIKAYSFNFTVVPHTTGQPLGYLTVWPAGAARPTVSTVNNPTGTVVANAAILPAGTNGAISVYPDRDTDLAVDINGYFGPAGSGGMSLYSSAPCRVLDTRKTGDGQPFTGQLSVNVAGSVCAPPADARGYVFNATVVPSVLGYLTLWPNGQERPLVSTLNALDGWITSNMAIVPTTNGRIEAFASGDTHLILDISAFFAP